MTWSKASVEPPFVFRLYTVPAGSRTHSVKPTAVSTWKTARKEARRTYRMLRIAGTPAWLARHAIVTMLVCGGSAAA